MVTLDIEMPKSCHECPVCKDQIHHCPILNKWCKYADIRMPDCPLTEIKDKKPAQLLLRFINWINHKQNCRKEYNVITDYPHPRFLKKKQLINEFFESIIKQERKNNNGV